MDETYDYMFKLALVGDPGAGKSWVLSRFVDGTLERLSSPGIIMCFSIRASHMISLQLTSESEE